MALPQQNTKRLLAYSGIAQIGYMLVGVAATSASGTAMVLFYLVAYVFGNMGAFLVVEALAQAEGSRGDRPRSAASRSARRCSRWPCCSSCSRSAASRSSPASGPSSTSSGRRPSSGLYWLVLLGAVLTVVALFYYLLLAKRMYIELRSAQGRRPGRDDARHLRPPVRARRGGARTSIPRPS